MTIIRTQKEVPEASDADLLESYNAYTGKSIKKFSSRAAAEAQTANAIMSAENEAGKLGIKKGSKPVAMTVFELELARNEKAHQLASGKAPEAATTEAPAAKGKGLRAALAEKAKGEPNKPKAKSVKKGAEGTRAAKVDWVEVVPEGGRSKMQEASQRKAVMDAIVGKAKSNKAIAVVGRDDKVKAVNITELQEDFHSVIRGHVLKLIFEGHVRAVEPVTAGA